MATYECNLRTRGRKGEDVFTRKEAKLRRLLREALELANSIDGPYDQSQFHGCDSRPEGTNVIITNAPKYGAPLSASGIRLGRLGTWGAIKEALLASGLETAEGLEVFSDCNEWSHPRCASLTND